jgi:F-type H+-transporting ATPase subunit epsilon
MVSTRNVIRIPDLGQLKQVVDEQFKTLDDKEKAARTAAARLEADLVRRFMELRKYG